jgi:hypothetical protein
MLQWLPGADFATRDEGARLVAKALGFYQKHVTVPQREFVTIAVGDVDGTVIAVVYHVKRVPADRIAGRMRKAGLVASSTSGDEHAETVLHGREPTVRAVGISNSRGPCPRCKQYFGETIDGFANVYWDSSAWIEE